MRTRVVTAAAAPSRMRISQVGPVMRSPQDRLSQGPASMARHQASSVSRS